MTGGFSVLPGAQEEGSSSHQQFKGTSRILGPPWAHLPTITVGLLGVQIFWSVEMSYASPYLLSLGLSKSSMAVVFVAGPLSGLIMQPLIGILADNSTSRFGRRRPYMMLGTFVCIFAMLLLGFTRAVASVFTGWDNTANDNLTIWFAILSIYLIDFSINAAHPSSRIIPVQAVDRALLVDTLPPSTQAAGNAWAARMLGFGSVVGFYVGNINLPAILPFLGHTQLQVLSIVVSFLLLAGHMTMAVMVKERVLLKSMDVDGKVQRKTFGQELKDIWDNIITLPRVIRQICLIQFFAWIAWFPVLFYSTIYVGDLYKRSVPSNDPIAQDATALDAEATRLGSRALFYSALLSLLINLVLPLFVSESASNPVPKSAHTRGFRLDTGGGGGFKAMWEKIVVAASSVSVPKRMQVHLASLWAVSHAVFAGCMFATFFTHSVFGSTFIIMITGFSWAVTQWAPFSLLAEAILTSDGRSNDINMEQIDDTAIRLNDTRSQSASRSRRTSAEQERVGLISAHHEDQQDEGDEDGEIKPPGSRSSLFTNTSAQVSRLDLNSGDPSPSLRGPLEVDEDDYEIVDDVRETSTSRTAGSGDSVNGRKGSSLSSKAGIILGIHNIFIVIPQFLVTGFSAVLFALLDPHKPALPSHHRLPVAPHPGPAVNTTVTDTTDVVKRIVGLVHSVESRAEASEGGDSNSVVYIFRIGGLAAAFAFVLSYRLARELRHK